MTPENEAIKTAVEFETDAARLESARDAMPHDDGAMWVIHCAHVYLAFDRNWSNPRHVPVELATRFAIDGAAARNVAARVRNGKGERGEALTVRDAYAHEASELRRLATVLRGLARVSEAAAKL